MQVNSSVVSVGTKLLESLRRFASDSSPVYRSPRFEQVINLMSMPSASQSPLGVVGQYERQCHFLFVVEKFYQT